MASNYIKIPLPTSLTTAGVDTFNSRSGTVVPQAGDYSSQLISITPSGNIASTNVRDAIYELDSEKQDTVIGGASSIVSSDLTANRALESDASGKVSISATTSTELSHLSGVTSSIQTQLNNKQPLDATLTSLSSYNTNGLLTQTSSDTFAGRTITGSSGRISVTNGNGVSGNPTLDLAATGVSADTYINPQIVVDQYGRISSATSSAGSSFDIEKLWELKSEFVSDVISNNQSGLTINSNGTGANVVTGSTFGIDSVENAIGVYALEGGTALNARSYYYTSPTAFLLLPGYNFYLKCRTAVDSLGSVGTRTYHMHHGFGDTTSSTSVTPSDGIFFRFTGNGTNTNWEAVTAASGVTTVVDTGVAVVANSFQLLEIYASNTTSTFYINGALVATINTNLPTSIGQFFGVEGKILNTTAGGVETIMYMDFLYAKASRSVAR